VDEAHRISLATLPTPLLPCPRLTRALGGPEIWVKRDDLTGLGGGGNKVRKLEYALGEAVAAGADTLVAIGVTQSNAVRQTAAAAAALGLECHVAVIEDRVARRDPEYAAGGNILLTRLFGAHLHPVSIHDDGAAATGEIASLLRDAGRTPAVIPYGVSSVTGALGYVAAAHELEAQASRLGIRIDAIVHASGSAGTQAGLIAGLAAHASQTRVIGVDVDADAARVAQDVARLAGGVTERISIDPERLPAPEVLGGHAGPSYGSVTTEKLDAIELFARSEGLILDPVYTATAASGLVGMTRDGTLGAGERVVFLHTGGWPGLFAYRAEVARRPRDRRDAG
jgi:L-cysteate sulfo-lyase